MEDCYYTPRRRREFYMQGEEELARLTDY